MVSGYSALRSDCTHFRFGFLSPNDSHAGGGVAVRNSYTGRFTAASIWEILFLIVLLTRGLRRTNTHQLAEHEDCIKGKTEILLTN